MKNFIDMFKANVAVADLKNALTVTWQGMIAIFIVMAVIALIVFFAAKFSGKKK